MQNLSTKDRIVAILTQAGKPLTFEQVYEALEKDGQPLPADKPKLVVRKTLYDARYFTTKDSRFSIRGDVAPTVAATPVVVPASAPVPVPVVEPPAAPTPAVAPAPTPVIMVTPPAPVIVAAPAPVVAAGPAPAKTPLRERIVAILAQAGKPLTFEQIYEALEKDGQPLPADKPKLVVRKVLFDPALFSAKDSRFTTKVAPSGDAPVAAPTVAPVPVPAPATPVVVAPSPVPAPAKVPAAPVAPSIPAAVPPAPAPVIVAAPAPVKTPLRERIVAILAQAGKPLTFEQIYEALEKDGQPLPADKPKLVVRKVLFDPALFSAKDSRFTTKVAPSGDASTPAPAAPVSPVTPSAAVPAPAAYPAAAPFLPVPDSPRMPVPDFLSGHSEAAATAMQEVRNDVLMRTAQAAALAAIQASGMMRDKEDRQREARFTAHENAYKAAQEAAEAAARSAREAAQEAAREAREAAIQAAQEAARSARDAAIQAAREVAREAAQQAAEAIRMKQELAAKVHELEASNKAREVMIQAAREAAAEAARQATEAAAREAARVAAEAARQAAMAAPVSAPTPAPIPVPEPPAPALTSAASGQIPGRAVGSSLRERIGAAMMTAGKPLTFEEVMQHLKSDGRPMPPEHPEEVIKRVLANARIFQSSGEGRYTMAGPG